MSLKLEDLVPEKARFKLRLTNKTYTLLPFTLDDEIWLEHQYGNRLQEIFSQLKMKEICEIAFHQIENKSDLKKRTVKFINENGDEATRTLGGVKLLHTMISGMKEKHDIITALLECIGVSRPMLKKIQSDEEKKSQHIAQPSRSKKRTGQK